MRLFRDVAMVLTLPKSGIEEKRLEPVSEKRTTSAPKFEGF
jgi:hypothetical protein